MSCLTTCSHGKNPSTPQYRLKPIRNTRRVRGRSPRESEGSQKTNDWKRAWQSRLQFRSRQKNGGRDILRIQFFCPHFPASHLHFDRIIYSRAMLVCPIISPSLDIYPTLNEICGLIQTVPQKLARLLIALLLKNLNAKWPHLAVT